MPRFAEPGDAVRVAVVGAPTTDGGLLRAALAQHGVAGSRVDLYGTTRGETVLSEYDGEARLIQEPDLGEIVDHRIIFLCEEGALAEQVTQAAGEDSVVIDLLDRGPARSDRVHVVPHSLSLLVADVLQPVCRAFELAEVTAIVLRPAADFGERGVEELREQTVSLLNFSEVSAETFGVQLAFNLIPQHRMPDGSQALEARLAGEVSRLLDWPEIRIACRLITAPLFYGHGMQLRFRLGQPVATKDVQAVFDRAGFVATGEASPTITPLEVTGEALTRVSGLAEDGLGSYWLWAVAGQTADRGAQHALRLAVRLGDL